MFTHLFSTTVMMLILFSGCDDSSSSDPGDAGGWLIPVGEVYDGGPGKDGIPAIDNPQFASASDAGFLADDELVIGMKIGVVVRAYPHQVLDWHEIVNDDFAGTAVSLTYCPLTGSAIAWNGMVNGSKTSFGVSGLLYNSNLIPYDRATDTYWSQMRLQAVSGDLRGKVAEVFPVIETTWKTWRAMYPETEVLSTETGISRPYGQYPYGSYRSNSQLLFPVSVDDTRLARKERVFGVIVDGAVRAYPVKDFDDDLEIINQTFRDEAIVVGGSSQLQYSFAFRRTLGDGTVLSFKTAADEFPNGFEDEEGNLWDVFGVAVSGPRSGSRLESIPAFTAYWFSWPAFFGDVEIH